MMQVRIWILVLCLGGMTAHAQLNVEFVSNLDYDPILNDIWGYVDDEGTEYALVGMTSGLSIVSLADPANPQEIQFIRGVNSTWRDIKTWGDFAYVTADQGQQGLLIVDLSTIPEDTAVYAFWRPNIPSLGFYNRAHNIWIDEFGLAYLAGANLGGTMILDVKSDPWNPAFLTNLPLDYAHDVYARDSLVYTSEIYFGELRVYDISDIENIQLLGFVMTPYAFTHNAWLSDDGNSIFTTDERANAFIGSYDVSDPTNIKELDRFRPAKTTGLDVIPHNVHVWNDYVIISYYTDGCIIVDASRPDNLIEVGNFDTYLSGHGGFSGAWGAYPFLPSGLLLISDRQSGLYVLAPEYVRGCYLEGTVRDSETQLPILNAQIEIILEPGDTSEVLLPEFTDLEGAFETGKAVSGTFIIEISHPDYFTAYASGMFENGVVLELHIDLVRKPTHQVTGRVVEASSPGSIVPFAHIAVQSNDRLYQTQADEFGNYVLSNVIEGTYRLYAGNWGMYSISEVEIEETLAKDIVVSRGYYDDFLYDYGWTVSGTSQGAVWERDIPVSELLFNIFPCNPSEDLADDFGSRAFITGNAGGAAEDDDVEEGVTILNSPYMDLQDFGDPVVSYEPWICERLIEEEVFFVSVSNGTTTVLIDTIRASEFGGSWMPAREIHLADKTEITEQMQLHFVAQDIFKSDNVIKAALDRVEIFDAMPTAVDDVTDIIGTLKIFPNPAQNTFFVDWVSDETQPDALAVYDVYGHLVLTSEYKNGRVDASRLVGGIYVVQVSGEGKILGTGRVILTE